MLMGEPWNTGYIGEDESPQKEEVINNPRENKSFKQSRANSVKVTENSGMIGDKLCLPWQA